MGHVNQCLGFCDRMGWAVSEQILIPGPSRMNSRWRNSLIRLKRRRVLQRLEPKQRTGPRLRIVASGTSAEPLVSKYRQLYDDRLYAAYIGSPRWPDPIFDFAAASNHALPPGSSPSPSYYPGARMTAWMPGVFVKPIAQDPSSDVRPVIVALIGGLNKAFRLDGDLIAHQLQTLAHGERDPMTDLIIVFSRRTPSKLEHQLRSYLTPQQAIFVDRHDRTAYVQAVRCARQFAVTPDSITMICESLATLKPVTVLDLPCFDEDTSTFRFVRELRSFQENSAGLVLKAASDHVLQMAASQHEDWLRR
jgi:uncharacterized protein